MTDNDMFTYLERVWAAFMEWIREAAEQLHDLAEAIGHLAEAEHPDTDWRPWSRQSRKPELRPLHLVDAVAAGRHPGMTLRTRIRGGRR